MFVALCCFSSCEEKNVPVTEDAIIGKWQLVSMTWELYQNEKLINSYEQDLKAGGVRLEFKENGVLVSTEGKGEKEHSETLQWELNGSLLVIDGVKYSIRKLTDSQLRFADMPPSDNVDYMLEITNLEKIK